MVRMLFMNFLERLNATTKGPLLRSWGRRMINAGITTMGSPFYMEQPNPSLRGITQNGVTPNLSDCFFVAPNATIIGDVTLGDESSAWYGSILRSGSHNIHIGDRAIIQDNTRVYSKSGRCFVGDDTIVGPNAQLDSCTIEEGCFIGAGAKIGAGATVQAGAFVAAGAIILPGTTVPSYQVWVGSPAKFLRKINGEERENIRETHEEAVKLSIIHAEENNKSMRQIINDKDLKSGVDQDPETNKVYAELERMGLSVDESETHTLDIRIEEINNRMASQTTKNPYYEPYEQSFEAFPENYKRYERNYEKYEELKAYFESTPQNMPDFETFSKGDPTKTEARFNNKY